MRMCKKRDIPPCLALLLQGLAEAINTMADAEQCSVIVDDIYFKPE